ncbi:MAG: metal-sulfur cluster assembly factor [Candidatus Aenigmatarchaeota archaeon]
MVEKDEVMEKLKNVIDPETDVSIVDMGFIKNVEIEGGKVDIDMTLTTPGCPLHSMFDSKIENEVTDIEDVEEVEVNMVFDEAWSPDMMSDEAKHKLGV